MDLFYDTRFSYKGIVPETATSMFYIFTGNEEVGI